LDSREVGVKISIILPKDLHVRLQRHRPRIRVTRTCQEALELALRREECRDAAEPNEVAGLIARLRVEKEKLESQDRATGFRDGRTRSFQFGYTDFKLFERISDTINRYGQGAKAEEILSSVLEDHGRDFLELFGAEEPSITNREDYLRGYIEGVVELWSEISDKL
jgi:hypothetical protein